VQLWHIPLIDQGSAANGVGLTIVQLTDVNHPWPTMWLDSFPPTIRVATGGIAA